MSSQQAVIQCNDSIIQPTSGFAFTNYTKPDITEVSIEKLWQVPERIGCHKVNQFN